jgi:hypothetical protein
MGCLTVKCREARRQTTTTAGGRERGPLSQNAPLNVTIGCCGGG